MTNLTSWIRFYHYMSGVLINRQGDYLCSKCKAYANTISAMQTGLAEMKSESAELTSISAELSELLNEADRRINSMNIPENTGGQKKAGKCLLPKGTCFVKSSKGLLKNIQETFAA
ncbi:MAG TPA: hypothetical protein ENG83_07860 [Nitrospirae bacterium]|nr:hypothetical protein BMS3Abin06_01864 [bacterium BMS3Abin06]HDH12096.1 hypothetical protein [Nitrospirota bacterium]HDZ03231.1 hypothetical protein [Nitrospirota bacterium]